MELCRDENNISIALGVNWSRVHHSRTGLNPQKPSLEWTLCEYYDRLMSLGRGEVEEEERGHLRLPAHAGLSRSLGSNRPLAHPPTSLAHLLTYCRPRPTTNNQQPTLLHTLNLTQLQSLPPTPLIN